MDFAKSLVLQIIVTLISLFIWNAIAEIKLPFWPFFWVSCVIPLGVAVVFGFVAGMVSDQ